MIRVETHGDRSSTCSFDAFEKKKRDPCDLPLSNQLFTLLRRLPFIPTTALTRPSALLVNPRGLVTTTWTCADYLRGRYTRMAEFLAITSESGAFRCAVDGALRSPSDLYVEGCDCQFEPVHRMILSGPEVQKRDVEACSIDRNCDVDAASLLCL